MIFLAAFSIVLGIGLAGIIVAALSVFIYFQYCKRRDEYDDAITKKKYLLYEMHKRINTYKDKLEENPNTLLTVLMPSNDDPKEKIRKLSEILNLFSESRNVGF